MAEWIYVQRSGNLYLDGPGYHTLIGTGYSGAANKKNDPDAQCYKDLGPIPRGLWRIGPLQNNTTGTGQVLPSSMRLEPEKGTDVCSRSGFLIHGGAPAGDVSNGCIVLAPELRQRIGTSGTTVLRVVREDA